MGFRFFILNLVVEWVRKLFIIQTSLLTGSVFQCRKVIGLNYYATNLVPRVSHLIAPGGGKMRDPGNEVATLHVWFKNLASPFHPMKMKNKTNTNCYSFAHVFPRFASAVASQADVLRLVTRSSPHSVRGEERLRGRLCQLCILRVLIGSLYCVRPLRLVHCIVCVLCDWLERLLWFWFTTLD